MASCVCPDLTSDQVCSDYRSSRCVALLPKAHLHLHLTGGMRHSTLVDLANSAGATLSDRLKDPTPLHVGSVSPRRSWATFQKLYDLARHHVNNADVIGRLMLEMCQDEAGEGSGWVELQVDPSGYVSSFGGLHEMLDVVLDSAAWASGVTGVGIGIIVAANRARHPENAATLARLAAQYVQGRQAHGNLSAGSGAVSIVGFGLSNDEVSGPAENFTKAFRIARNAGLSPVPHAGELSGADSVRAAILELGAVRVGHGVRAVEDPRVVDLMVQRRVAAEVCPASNQALGVYSSLEEVPLRRLFDAGVPIALSADDPLLFGSRLAGAYRTARHVHGFDDSELARMASDSILSSHAPDVLRTALLAGVDSWLASSSN